MRTDELIPGCPFSREVTGICSNADDVRMGEVFFALSTDLNKRIAQITAAIAKGASLIVCQESTPVAALPENLVLKVSDPLTLLDRALKKFHFSQRPMPTLAAVTGTNGKTSTAYYVYQILQLTGRKAAFIGTVGGRIGEEFHNTKLTTPDICDFYKFLAAASAKHCEVVTFEYSSHALQQRRLLDVQIPFTTFTNLTQDHLDYHGTMEEYFQAKRRLFTEHLANGVENFAFLNLDDAYGQRLQHDPDIKRIKVAFGRDRMCTFRIEQEHIQPELTKFTAVWRGKPANFQTHLLGTHNVMNISAACLNAIHLGVDFEQLPRAVSLLQSVPGRFENIPNRRGLRVIVDYAHTPDALEKVLHNARAITTGRLIVVFGCGGNRDTAKRPVMGEIAVRMADVAIVTSDNPRNEDPEKILDDITRELPREKFYREVCRRTAIAMALDLAKPGDTVVIAGKGHEATQEIAGVFHPFSDVEVARELLGQKEVCP